MVGLISLVSYILFSPFFGLPIFIQSLFRPPNIYSVLFWPPKIHQVQLEALIGPPNFYLELRIIYIPSVRGER